MYYITKEDEEKIGFFSIAPILCYDENKEEYFIAKLNMLGGANKIVRIISIDEEKEYQNGYFYEIPKLEFLMPFHEELGDVYDLSNTKLVLKKEQAEGLTEYLEILKENLDYFKSITAHEIKDVRGVIQWGGQQNQEVQKEEIEANIESMTGVEFEVLVEGLVKKMGFEVFPTKASGDGGIDLIAYNHQPFLEGKYIIQCKRWNSSIGEPVLRDLYGAMMSERANKGILITNSTFTNSAKEFAKDKPLELIDGERLNTLLDKYDITFKPLTSRYCPIREVYSNYPQEEIERDYSLLLEELSSDKDNYQVRCKLMDMLLNNIFCDMHQLTKKQLEDLIAAVRQHIDYFYKCRTNHQIQCLKNRLLIIDAQLCIIQGELLEAVKKLYKVLEAQNNDDEIKLVSLINIMQIYNILEMKEHTQRLYERYRNIYEDKEIYSVFMEYESDYMKVTRFCFDDLFSSSPKEGSTLYSEFFTDENKYIFMPGERQIIMQYGTVGVQGFPLWGKGWQENKETMIERMKILF